MAEVNPTISINIDTSDSLRQIRSLQSQLSAFNDSVLKSSAQAVAAQKSFNSALSQSVLGTKEFSTSIVRTSTEVDSFTQKLEKNKLGFGQYFRYGASQIGAFRKTFENEFGTIERVATERVKRLQTQYISLGKDANGVARSMAIIPNQLDMSNPNTQMQLAAQRTQIFNKLLTDGSTKLLNFGKNTQWAGRQLMVGFTLPLAAFGSVASKTFMDLEQQTTKFKRVYGDLFTTTEETNRNLEAVKSLGIEYTKYGISLSDSLDIAAKAAAAGMQNEKLIAGTEETLRLATLGQIDYNQALDATISLQNAFSIGNEQLSSEIDFLNAVENQTIVSLGDITTAIPRAATVVRGLGGDVRDLAAFMAALEEGGVSAEQGANALKSGLASLINPTNRASEILGKLGINVKGIVSANQGNLLATVQEFGKALDGLGSFERQQALETLFGKYQYARLGVLFQNINKQGSQAATVLQLAGSSAQDLANLSEKELSIVSETTTAKFQSAVEKLKVAIAPLGEEFLKILTPIADVVAKIANWFNDLPGGVKKAVTIITVAVAGVGPVALMAFGLFANGLANIVKGLVSAKAVFSKFLSVVTGNTTNTEYLAMAELDAAAASASLEGKVDTLTSSLVLQKDAVADLISLYSRLAEQAKITASSMPQGFGPPMMGPLNRLRRMATGGFVAGTGNKDTEPALLTPGEFVVTADAAAKYGPILGAMNSGTLSGYSDGTPSNGKTAKYTDLAHVGSAVIAVPGTSEAPTLDFSKANSAGKTVIEIARQLGLSVSYVRNLVFEFSDSLNRLLSNGSASIQQFDREWTNRGPAKWTGTLEQAGISTQNFISEISQFDEALKREAMQVATARQPNVAQANLKIGDADVEQAFLNLSDGFDTETDNLHTLGKITKQEADARRTVIKALRDQYNSIVGVSAYFDQTALETMVLSENIGVFSSKTGEVIDDIEKLKKTVGRLTVDLGDEGSVSLPPYGTSSNSGEKNKRSGKERWTVNTINSQGEVISPYTSIKTRVSPEVVDYTPEIEAANKAAKIAGTTSGVEFARSIGRSLKEHVSHDVRIALETGLDAGINPEYAVEFLKAAGFNDAKMKTHMERIAQITEESYTDEVIRLGVGRDVVGRIWGARRKSPHPDVDNFAVEDTNMYTRTAQTQVEKFRLDPTSGLYVPTPGSVTGGRKSNRQQAGPSEPRKPNQPHPFSPQALYAGSALNALAIETSSFTENLSTASDSVDTLNQETNMNADELDSNTTEQRKQKRSIRNLGGKMFGMTMAVDAVAMGMSAFGVQIPAAGQAALVGLNAISMLTPLIPMLANPIALVAVALAAVAASMWAINKMSNDVVDRSKNLVKAMYGASENVNAMANYFGKKTYSQQLTELSVQKETGVKQKEKTLTEAQQFLESDPGKKLISDIASVKETLGSKRAADALSNQLLRSVLSGSIGPKMATAIATQMATTLGDKEIAVDVSGKITRLLGADGQNIDANRMSIFAEIIADATDLRRAMSDAGLQWDGEAWYSQVSMIVMGRGTADLTAAGLSEALIQGQDLIREELDRNRLAFEQNKIGAEEFLATNEKILLNAKDQGLTWEGVRDKFNAAYPDSKNLADSISQPILDSLFNSLQIGGGEAFRNTFVDGLKKADLSGMLKSVLSIPGESISDTKERLVNLGQEAGAAGSQMMSLQYIDVSNPASMRVALEGVNELLTTYEGLSAEQRSAQGLNDEYYKGLTDTLSTLQSYETGTMRIAVAVESGQLSTDSLKTFLTEKKLTSRQLMFQVGTMSDATSAGIMELINQSGGKGVAIDLAWNMILEGGGDGQDLKDLLLELTRGNKNQINVDLVLDTQGLPALRRANDLMEAFDKLPKENRKKVIGQFIDENFSTFYGNLDWFLKQDDLTQKTFMANYIVSYDEQGNLSATGQALLAAAMGKDQALARNVAEGRISPQQALSSVLQKPFVTPTTTKPPKVEDDKKDGGGGEKKKTPKDLYNEDIAKMKEQRVQLSRVNEMQLKLNESGKTYSSKIFEAFGPESIKYLMNHQNKLKEVVIQYRMLQEQRIDQHFNDLSSQMKETTRITKLLPNASQELIQELIGLGDTTVLTGKQIKSYGTQLIQAKRDQEAMKTSAQKLEDQVGALGDAFKTQIEEINRINIKPLEDQVKSIEDAIASIESTISNLEASKIPLQSQIDALKKQEEEIQALYDERIKSLDQIKRSNDKISAQQKGQLSIADALSQGDISAAAAAAQQLQDTMNQQDSEEMRIAIQLDADNQREIIARQIAAIEARIAGIDAQIATEQGNISKKQKDILDKQKEIETQKERQLALEEKIYKLQLLQSMIDTSKKIQDASLLGRTDLAAIYQSQLGTQMSIAGGGAGGAAAFFSNLGLTPESLQNTLNNILKVGMIDKDKLTQVIGQEAANSITAGLTLATNKSEITKPLSETSTKISGIAEKTKTAIDGVVAQFNEGKIGIKGALIALVAEMSKGITEGLVAKANLSPFSQAIKELGNDVGSMAVSFAKKVNSSIEKIIDTVNKVTASVSLMDGPIQSTANAVVSIGTHSTNLATAIKDGINKINQAFSTGISASVNVSNASIGVGNLGVSAGSATVNTQGGVNLNNNIVYRSKGGLIPGTGTKDTVPAMLTPGEFVITKNMTRTLGINFLNNLNNGSIPEYSVPQTKTSMKPYSSTSQNGNAVYNYSINVPTMSTANAGDIANVVMRKIKMTEARTIKGNNY